MEGTHLVTSLFRFLSTGAPSITFPVFTLGQDSASLPSGHDIKIITKSQLMTIGLSDTSSHLLVATLPPT